MAWEAKNDYAKAIRDYGEAARLDPQFATFLHQTRRRLERAERVRQSNLGLRRAHPRESPGCDVVSPPGPAWHGKKDDDKAIRNYDEAIRLDPQNVRAFVFRAFAWSDKKDYDKAIRDADEAIRLNPNDAVVFIGRGTYGMARRTTTRRSATTMRPSASIPGVPTPFKPRPHLEWQEGVRQGDRGFHRVPPPGSRKCRSLRLRGLAGITKKNTPKRSRTMTRLSN